MAVNPFGKGADAHPRRGMVGTKMDGARAIGCAHGGRLSAIAAKGRLVGTGRGDPLTKPRPSVPARGGASRMLVEVEVAPGRTAAEDRSFDGPCSTAQAGSLARCGPRPPGSFAALQDPAPGGRGCGARRNPLGGLRAPQARASEPSFAAGALHELLTADGFRPVRTLAERDGLVFIEAAKPRE